jgi:hypothetical protein
VLATIIPLCAVLAQAQPVPPQTTPFPAAEHHHHHHHHPGKRSRIRRRERVMKKIEDELRGARTENPLWPVK